MIQQLRKDIVWGAPPILRLSDKCVCVRVRVRPFEGESGDSTRTSRLHRFTQQRN